MAVNYNETVKNARLQTVVGAIDAGAGPGVLIFGTTGMATILAQITLADPCGTVAGGVLTFDFDPDLSDSSADNAGVAAVAKITDSDGGDIVAGLTVGLTGSDANIELDNTNIAAGQVVTIASGTISHA